MATSLGCEFRLGEETPAADLFVAVRPGNPLARHFIRRGGAAHPDSAAAALARYLAEIGQAGSPTGHLVLPPSAKLGEAELRQAAGARPAWENIQDDITIWDR